MFINDEQCQKALDFITENADEYGRLRGQAESCDHLRKAMRSQVMLDSEQTSDGRRLAEAECSGEYAEVVQELENARADLQTMVTRMKAAELTIEVWRSLNSAARRGNI